MVSHRPAPWALVVAALLGMATLAACGRGGGLEDVLTDLECEGCNVVLLTMDTVRADVLPCYGYPRDTTPAICDLGAGALLFENAISPAPSTIPALTSIMSGQIVANEELDEILGYFERRTALAERLGELGYATAGFTDHRTIGTPQSPARAAAPLLRGFDHFENLGQGRDWRRSEPLTDAALEWLDDHRDERFFLWAHYFDPHFNWNPPPELEGRFGFDAATCGRIVNGIDIQRIRRIERSLTEREVECLKALYLAELLWTDGHVGRLLARIEELGLGDETLVVITSDHGEEFLERSRIGHERTVYNELVRVPLILDHPRLGARRLPGFISTASLFPILVGAVSGQPIELDEEVVTRTNHYYRPFTPDAWSEPNTFAIFGDGGKATLVPAVGTAAYYDLAADPGERESLSGTSEADELHRRLLVWLERHHTTGPGASEEAKKAFDEAQRQLKSLGYVR